MKFLRWRGARYAVPAVAVAAIALAAFVPTISGASSPPDLPAQSPQQLLADLAVAKVPPLSGTVTWSPNLGLNDLSALEDGAGQGDSSSGFDPLTLLSGTWQATVWLDGAHAEHLALLEPSAQELDLVRNDNQGWLWNSSNQSVLHLIGPSSASQSGNNSAGTGLGGLPITPDQFASLLLSHLSPSTLVTSGTPVYVADQPAYQLVISPKGSPRSTIDQIQIDVGATGSLLGVPLRVSVFAKGQCQPPQTCTPALQLGYTGQIHLGTPPASELTFTRPPGAKVVTRTLGSPDGSARSGTAGSSAANGPGWFAFSPLAESHSGTKSADLGLGGLSRSGSGWTTVLSAPAGVLFANAEAGPLSEVTRAMTLKGEPARLFGTSLLNVLLTSNGRAYVGFVTPSVLEAAASAST
jgi:hypothetical protein